MKAIRRFTVRTVLPETIAPLADLARNLRWSWHVPTRELFERLDAKRWKQSHHDPLRFLGSFSREDFAQLAQSAEVQQAVAEAGADLQAYLSEPRWYQNLDGAEDYPRAIGYFSPEFGITEVLPQYSGGLGILAGDHLKTASDLGVPIVGVGLLYQAGYFRQSLSKDAWQQETYPVLDPDGLPLSLLREDDGRPVEISLPLPEGRELKAWIWRADVGRVPLLLLDSNIPGNDEAARAVTDRLYGGGGEHRLHQELLLGMGGVKALRAYSRLTGAPAPEVFHTNEGHAGFLGIERIRELMETEGLSFDEALAAGRAGTVFTTHTPVPAGIDRFPQDLIRAHFQAPLAPGVEVEDVLSLGSESYEGGDAHVFNMAVMGLRLAQRANGVAKLHGEVSREMFSGLWPGFDHDDVPISSVTNGVHVPTWLDPRISQLVADRFGGDILATPDWSKVYEFTDADIWAIRKTLRADLVKEARRRLRKSWRQRGAADAELAWTDSVLDPDVLTIGFARRVPTYKRLTLMLRDPARLKRLLLDPQRPIQLVIAGKSHPADEAGKRMIQDLVRFTDDPEVRHRIVFLPNYDIAMARTLFPGCDVWLNNPLRPLEACGTSGMKAAINGGLNLSVLDGWWDEMYDGENGWAIPTANNGASAEERDDIEAAALYELLENVVAPKFYGGSTTEHVGDPDLVEVTADSRPVPAQWISMIKHTLAELGPQVAATRMLNDYVHKLYLPAARAEADISADHYAAARELAAWKAKIRSKWQAVALEHVDTADGPNDRQIGDELNVRVVVYLDGLDSDDVDVELVYGKVNDADELSQTKSERLHVGADLGGGRREYIGSALIEHAGNLGYTVQVTPAHPRLANPAELGLIVSAN